MNRIPSEFNISSIEFLIAILNIYNKVFYEGYIDEIYLVSVIFPIFKKGCRSAADFYRGISFLNAPRKIFLCMLLNRLTNLVNNNSILTEMQCGSRKGYSTLGKIFTLVNSLYQAKTKKLFTFFIDLKLHGSAFL